MTSHLWVVGESPEEDRRVLDVLARRPVMFFVLDDEPKLALWRSAYLKSFCPLSEVSQAKE